MKFSEVKSFERIPVIYGIKNEVNSKWYIGSCTDMKDRFQRHRYYLRHNMHHSTKLQRAYNVYGEDMFSINIIHFLTAGEDRFKIEEKYIREYDAVKNGYNMLEKCIYTDNFTLSEKAKDNFLAYIRTLEKSVMAINRFTGEIENTFPSVTKAAEYYHTSSSNVSRTCKGIYGYIKDRVFIYTRDFDETKDYRAEYRHKGEVKSESHKEKLRHSKLCRPIGKYDLEGNLIQEFYSISEAARQLNVGKDYLRYKINKKKSLDGFIYERIQVL